MTTEAPTAEKAAPSEAVLEQARALVKKYYSGCFWFRHPDATLETYDDVKLVVKRLRENGGHEEWKAVQELWKCL